ncbi:hypothetical protein ARMGADRAFT_922794 [Armillaria gallica]|uniref:NAD(P)-binding domain-containing protein n=1 Tax=Armillaria gallica TaxID=47427 RepID=A0A2H3E920_ARMGA|nr:hypothetical protein ARMGADRAFT_922794 [Armillaria gallica]
MTPIYIRQSGCSISSIRHYVESQHILYWSNRCVAIAYLLTRTDTTKGYIGGTILSRLIEHKDSKNFDITILLRPTRSSAGYEALGLKTVSGSDADLSLLRAQAAAADVIFATADSDDLPAAQAILQGAKAHYEKTGKAPILIHTSGTGELTNNARRLHSTDVVYSDLDIPLFETLPPSQPHRNVDLAVITADNEGYVMTYIVLPPTIYGVPTGILHKHSLQRTLVSQGRVLVEVSIARKQGGVVGEGFSHPSPSHRQPLEYSHDR